MKASSASTRIQNGFAACLRVIRPMRPLAVIRAEQPEDEQTPTFVSTRRPYGVSSDESSPTRMAALRYPEAATTTKQMSAMVE